MERISGFRFQKEEGCGGRRYQCVLVSVILDGAVRWRWRTSQRRCVWRDMLVFSVAAWQVLSLLPLLNLPTLIAVEGCNWPLATWGTVGGRERANCELPVWLQTFFSLFFFLPLSLSFTLSLSSFVLSSSPMFLHCAGARLDP